MLFTFIAGLVACRSMALRPDAGRARRSHTIAELGNIVKGISNASESMPVLRAATGIVEDILAQNATEHLSDDDEALLREVVEMIETSMYKSMDSAHKADQFELNQAAKAVAQCNAVIEARQAPSGDLGKFYKGARDKQTELDRLQREVDAAYIVNETEWKRFSNYMKMIPNAPGCPAFPEKPRTITALDVYFKDSAYVTWFTSQQPSYYDARQKFLDADAALQAAIDAFNKQRGLRDLAYCNWKAELEEACAEFDRCYDTKSKLYTDVIVPRIRDDMAARIEIHKAGETLIHQVRFLLAEEEKQETPPVDSSRYELDFPVLDAKGVCNLDILDAAYWVPTVECEVEYEVCKGLHETTCGTDVNWHESIKPRTDATLRCVPGWAKTSGGTCKQWCEERGYDCLRAQDVHPGRCQINPQHTRQTTEENGCLQKWHDQMCECGRTAPPKTCQWTEESSGEVTFTPHCHPPNFHATCNAANEGKFYFAFGRGSARKTHPLVDVGGGDAQQLSGCDGGWLHHNAKKAALKITCTC